jgi:hypothetical protein
METSEAQGVRYDVLVDRVIENFAPARRIWPVGARLALWLALECGILLLIAFGVPRPDLLMALHTPWYLLQSGLFIFAGAVAAALALRTAIPGREATRNELIAVAVAAMTAVLAAALMPAQTGISVNAFFHLGVRCLECTWVFAALPWFALFWAVKRGAPFLTRMEGVLIGTAAFSFAFAATRLGCSIDDSLHLLVWHIMPAAAGTGLSMLAGIAWLKRTNPVSTAVFRRPRALIRPAGE